MNRVKSLRRSRIASNIGWNFASGIASVFGLLLLYPLSVKIAGPEAYGIWVLAFGAIQLFTLADFGLGTGIVRTLSTIHPNENRHIDRRRFVTVAGCIFTVLALGLSVGCYLLFPLYLDTVTMSNQLRELVPVVVSVASGCLFISVMGRFANATLWAEDRPDIERKAALASLVLRAGGLVYALWGGYGILLVIAVEAVSVLLPSIICCLIVARKYGLPVISRQSFGIHAGPLLRISGVLFVGTFASVAASQVPLYIVGTSLGLSATTAFGALLRIFQSAKLSVSWVTNPFTHSIVSSSVTGTSSRAAAKKCFELALGAALLIAVPLWVLPERILTVWMGDKFTFISSALAVVAVSVVANGLILPSALVTTLRANPWPTSLLGVVVLVLTAGGVYLGAQDDSVFWATVGLVAPLAITAPGYVLLAHRQVDLTPDRQDVIRAVGALACVAFLALVTYGMSMILTPIQVLFVYALLAVVVAGGTVGLTRVARLRS